MHVADQERKEIRKRGRTDLIFHLLFLASTTVGVFFLMLLLIDVIRNGFGWLTPHFFTQFPSRNPEKAGILSGLVGTGYMIAIMFPLSFILGVGAAIYLEEYAVKNRIHRFIQVNIRTLAGVPSIIYGILGLAMFVRGGGIEQLAMGRSILSGAFTMTLLVLPIIIVASQEAIRAIPKRLRDASYALGADRWNTIQRIILPTAFPGILTGVILALSRAIGETAPLVMIGALTYVAFLPESPFDQFTVIPIQIYNWVSRPQTDFHGLAAAGILILLPLLILMNLSAILIRNKYQKHQ